MGRASDRIPDLIGSLGDEGRAEAELGQDPLIPSLVSLGLVATEVRDGTRFLVATSRGLLAARHVEQRTSD